MIGNRKENQQKPHKKRINRKYFLTNMIKNAIYKYRRFKRDIYEKNTHIKRRSSK